MEKQKRWQLYLILAVLVITLYNILPTIFYYSNPLRQPVGPEQAEKIAHQIVDRVNGLESQSVDWLKAYTELLGLKPTEIELQADEPQFVAVRFSSKEEADRFRAYINRAGAMIPFTPAQLQFGGESSSQGSYTVLVERQIGVHLDPADIGELFSFAWKYDDAGHPTQEYREVVFDRVALVAQALGGESQRALEAQALVSGDLGSREREVAFAIAEDLQSTSRVLQGQKPDLFSRYLASYSQVAEQPEGGMASALAAKLSQIQSGLRKQQQLLMGEDGTGAKSSQTDDPEERAQLGLLEKQAATLSKAIAILQENEQAVNAGVPPLQVEALLQQLRSTAEDAEGARRQILSLEGRNPYIQSLTVDWDSSQLLLNFYEDVQATRNASASSEQQAYLRDRVNQLLVNDVARASRLTDENISPLGETFGVSLSQLTASNSFLAFNLSVLAQKQADNIIQQLKDNWMPQHPDLVRDTYPLRTYAEQQELSPQEQRLGLVVYAPAQEDAAPPRGFDYDGVYVIAKGVQDILSAYREVPDSEGANEFMADFQSLISLMEQRGFMHYPGSSLGIDEQFSRDYIFRLPNYYDYVIRATREDFLVKGSARQAILDFSDVEQRLITLNRIEDQAHEDLLKWRDEYMAAQVDLNEVNHFLVPAPTENVYWQNFLLSMRKYFRGDDSKILRWGLDLSGGKTVRIGLLDQNNRPVTKEEDLKQAVNELYSRINKMGVAERSIRIEGNNIILDFPGSQGLSASELVKASSMYFNIVNEKFGPRNPDLAEATNRFLQEVWNEAAVTNRKDAESLNSIAWKHLGGGEAGEALQPRSEHARILYENGLRIASPEDPSMSVAFNDTISKITRIRGDDSNAWHGQTHPLMIVFRNYALEGSSLSDIQAGYDPNEGNTLSFGVRGSYEGRGRNGNPREDFYAWTSQYAKDQVAGTPKEKYSQGEGWRMAVILNDQVISSPTLSAPLRDRAQITGRFTQREVNQLVADLKAGSLTFTPRILSEQNVSPDLGKEERDKGITASLIALAAVVVLMVAYYRLAGIVASCAVLLNLIIMWGVLQNLGAALTLPGIAGIVLTIGMAVDANVLVFERIREEFAISGRIASAIQAGYRKAFSAIVDSNITTLIAAIILTQFDSGPIKGFAVTLIIGIISSMFTALFMTRYFFAGWVQNPKHRELKMVHLLGETHFDFLKHTRIAVIISGVLIVAGGYLLGMQRSNILGMDFTGGYSLTVDVAEKPLEEESYRYAVKQALEDAGLSSKDVQVQQLSRENQLRIQLSAGLEEEGQPFYGLPDELKDESYEFPFQQNPRIDWVVATLSDAGIQLQNEDLVNLHNQWTVMSGQFSDAMRSNAGWALSLALIAILLYITFRFEFKYAIAAVIALTHDVVITLGILAFFHMMGFPVQIDLEVIGAIMTIIGYSLNDTIIVFDRIREDLRILRKLSFSAVVNHAINVTLSRTLMTSGTTLLVLLSLVLLGGPAIFGFSLVMTIGVVVGTFSSLFIAPAAMLFFHNREEQQAAASGQLKRA